jgi:hypothetical protein
MPTRERNRCRDHCEKDDYEKNDRQSVFVVEMITHISATDNEQWHRECQGFIVEEDVSGGAGTHGDCSKC